MTLSRRDLFRGAAAVAGGLAAGPITGVIDRAEAAMAATEYEAIGLPLDAPRKAFRERRAFIEQQCWLENATYPFEGIHIHSGAAWPVEQVIVGLLEFDIRVLFHNMPPQARMTRLRVWGNGSDRWALPSAQFIKPSDCPESGVWYSGKIDVSGWAAGRYELRVACYVVVDGITLYTSSGIMVVVKGQGVNKRALSYGVNGRGWATFSEYVNVRWDPLVAGNPSYLYQPVSGLWKPPILVAVTSSGKPVTSHFASVDPNVHAGNPGLVLRDAAGTYKGPVGPIDTTELPNGVHRLMGRSAAKVGSQTCHGVQVVPFRIENPS